MDEARLKWFESIIEASGELHPAQEEELIAALRDAWRERDSRFTLDEYTRATDAAKRHCERAARAESSLNQLREAAEAAYRWCEAHIQRDVWRDMVTPLPEEIRDLRRALDVCAAKDPAR